VYIELFVNVEKMRYKTFVACRQLELPSKTGKLCLKVEDNLTTSGWPRRNFGTRDLYGEKTVRPCAVSRWKILRCVQPFWHVTEVWQTPRQTDGRTDRWYFDI